MTEQDKKLISSYSFDDLNRMVEEEIRKAIYWTEKQFGGDSGLKKVDEGIRNHLNLKSFTLFSSKPEYYQGKDLTWAMIVCACNPYGKILIERDYILTYGEGDDIGYIDRHSCGDFIIYTSELIGSIENDARYDGNNESRRTKAIGMLATCLMEYVPLYLDFPDDMTMKEVSVAPEDVKAAHAVARTPPGSNEVYDVMIATNCYILWGKKVSDRMYAITKAVSHEWAFDGLRQGDDRYNVFCALIVRYRTKLAERCNVGYDIDAYQPITASPPAPATQSAKPAPATPPDSVFINKHPLNVNIELNDITKPRNEMDKTMTLQLRRIMKEHGLRDKYENLIKLAHTTVDSYLEWVEPIYAVSRLRPFITNEKDKPKFLAADKKWTAFVIEQNRCALISDYTQRYTKPVVIQAINYLMDNSLWESPIGSKDIRKSNPEIYKGIKAIDEAVEYLRSEGKLVSVNSGVSAAVTTPESATPATVPDASPSVSSSVSPAHTGKRSKAQQAFAALTLSLSDLKDKLSVLEEYFNNDDLCDLLEEENTQLLSAIEELKVCHGKEAAKQDKVIASLDESIKTVKQQYNDSQKEVERQKKIAYDATKERDLRIDNFNKLHKQYEEMRENYEALKREAQKSKDIPKAKIIPLSKLRDIPLVGPALLKGLIPFLKQYNIVVDDNK